ncbi:MAG TPA: response regulator [Burkholderiales bacterium]|jgi:PAS domain S-box-containing protein|nr:response regulator [Burkholderiales bacterium]
MIRRIFEQVPIAVTLIGLMVLVAALPPGLGYLFQNTTVAALALAAALLAGGLLALELTRPLRELRARAMALAVRHGAAPEAAHCGNEIVALRGAFIAMTESLERDRRRLELAHQQATEHSHELARREHEARDLAMVASRTHNAVIITDAAGLVLWVNQAFTRITGYALDEVRGRKPGSLLQGPGTDPATVARMREHLAAGAGFHCEILNYSRDGREYWLDVEVQPIYDGAGRIEKFMAVELDITDRKLKEQDLRQAEEFLDSVVENIPAMVFVKDAQDLRYQRINRAAEQILGMPRAAFVGKNDYDFFSRDKAERYIAQDRAALAAAEALEVESDEFSTATGELRILRTRKLPIRDKNGAPRYLLGISEDVTEQRNQQARLRQATEEALAASRAKSQFLANMSHEIRTPMNGVLGMTELLLGTQLSDRQRRFAETVYRSGEALLQIINDILDFSKIEAGKLELQKEEFALAALIEEIGELLAPRAHAKRVELACEVGSGLPPLLVGDAGRIRQVLTNLAGNAIKFTEAGEVLVKAAVAPGAAADAASCTVCFTVRDTGIGMPPEVLERLFRVFEQGSSSATKRYGGTGLGLAISQHLVQMMDGNITVSSEAGHGSTFEFRLTLPVGARTAAVAPLGEPAASLAGKRILVVEDNPTNRGILAQQMRNWGAECAAVDQGFSALDALEAAVGAGWPFDAALIDMKMPGMSGVELAERIHRSPRLAATRLAMLTSLSGPRDLSRARAAGIDLYLEKPVRQAELQRALRKLLAQPIPPARLQAAPQPGDGPPARIGGHVLVVEDNPVNREIAGTMLEQLGYSHAIAENGREALQQLSGQSFDLVLMDCQMPEMDGFEALRHIRAGGEGATLAVPTDVPVIALTANALAGDRERCIEAGFNDYLSKPFAETDLQAVLSRWPCAAVAAVVALPPPVATPVPAAPAAEAEGVPDSPLDPRILHTLRTMERGGAHGLIARLSGAFLASAPELFEQLRQAAACGDMAAARMAAHTLKSSNANIGAVAVSKLFARIEADARASEAAATAGRLDEAEHELRRVFAALQNLSPA